MAAKLAERPWEWGDIPWLLLPIQRPYRPEGGFRRFGSELGSRPVHHGAERRIGALFSVQARHTVDRRGRPPRFNSAPIGRGFIDVIGLTGF